MRFVKLPSGTVVNIEHISLVLRERDDRVRLEIYGHTMHFLKNSIDGNVLLELLQKEADKKEVLESNDPPNPAFLKA